jgi:hypothetical protein
MATTTKGDFHGGFIVMNSAAVDLANHTAVLSVDTDIDVEALDGGDQNPLKAGDIILGPIASAAGGWAALEAGIVVQGAIYKDANTLTLRTTNASAGAVNPASIAANLLYFIVFRR